MSKKTTDMKKSVFVVLVFLISGIDMGMATSESLYEMGPVKMTLTGPCDNSAPNALWQCNGSNCTVMEVMRLNKLSNAGGSVTLFNESNQTLRSCLLPTTENKTIEANLAAKMGLNQSEIERYLTWRGYNIATVPPRPVQEQISGMNTGIASNPSLKKNMKFQDKET